MGTDDGESTEIGIQGWGYVGDDEPPPSMGMEGWRCDEETPSICPVVLWKEETSLERTWGVGG